MKQATLITFDIDGTLLKFGGNSVNHPIAMMMAFNEMFHENIKEYPEKFINKPVRGWTDYHLACEMFKKTGREITTESISRFQKIAEEKYKDISINPPVLTPGVHELLSKLITLPNIKLAIATGSFPNIAKRKLIQSGLMKYFNDKVGGYGDSYYRSDVIRNALKEAEQFYKLHFPNKYHVGDTSSDVQSSIECGFKSIAVKTGHQKSNFPTESMVIDDFASGYDTFIEIVNS